jgi:hypothetical protein
MGKIREVYTYTSGAGSRGSVIPLAPPSSSIGTTLTNTAEIRNNGGTPLYDKRENIVGKYINNRNINYFENNDVGFLANNVFLLNDGSYVMTLTWFNSKSTSVLPNTKTVAKSISTSGKYAGKDVTVTIKTDETLTRKVILEYEE